MKNNIINQNIIDAWVQVGMTSFIGCISSSLILISLDIPKIVTVPVLTIGVISLFVVFGLSTVKNKLIDEKVRLDCTATEEKINSLIKEILSSKINFETNIGKNLKAKIKDILEHMLELSQEKDNYGGERLFYQVYMELDSLFLELMRNYRHVYQKQEEEAKAKKKQEEHYQRRYQNYNNSYSNDSNSDSNRRSNRSTSSNGNSEKQGYLGVLGLAGNVTDWDYIKNTYRKLCKKYHTDINKSANALEIMQSINVAYSELEKIYG